MPGKNTFPYLSLTNKDPGQGTILKVNDEKTYGSFQPAPDGAGSWRRTGLTWLLWLLTGCLAWASLYFAVYSEVLPLAGGFQLLVLLATAQLAGLALEALRLPGLVGMLLTGVILRTAGFMDLDGVYPHLVTVSRDLALSVILIKAGLELDAGALKKMKFTVLRLACLPCVVEAAGAAFAGIVFFGLPPLWAFLIGFALSPISPAVVVPTLLALKEKGYGEDKGISTLVIASSSIDDVLSISVFGVIMGYIFSSGGSLAMALVHGPLELTAGVAGGCMFGALCGYIPKPGQAAWQMTLMVALGGFVAVAGSAELGVPGAGPLFAITSAFVANIIWTAGNVFPSVDKSLFFGSVGVGGEYFRLKYVIYVVLLWTRPEDDVFTSKVLTTHTNRASDDYQQTQNQVSVQFGYIWKAVQPALFGLIGAEVDLTVIEVSLLLQSFTILLTGLLFRLLACMICLIGIGLNWKEMLFVNLAWIPKATVQAALGPQPLDYIREYPNPDRPQDEVLAKLVLTTAVLAIILTAPLGSIGITLSGPRFLNRAQRELEAEEFPRSGSQETRASNNTQP